MSAPLESPHSRLVAFLFSAIAFPIALAYSGLIFSMGHLSWAYAPGVEDPAPPEGPAEALIGSLYFALALACSAFVFRVCRRTVSPAVVFHVAFFTGFGMLCYGLWLTLTTFSLFNDPLLIHWSLKNLPPPLATLPLFFAPVVCFAVVPPAVLLLSFATARDLKRPTLASGAPSSRPSTQSIPPGAQP